MNDRHFSESTLSQEQFGFNSLVKGNLFKQFYFKMVTKRLTYNCWNISMAIKALKFSVNMTQIRNYNKLVCCIGVVLIQFRLYCRDCSVTYVNASRQNKPTTNLLERKICQP